MILAREKKKHNIVEYLLYMFNVEEVLRTLNFEMDGVESTLIAQYNVDEALREEIREWYRNIIKEMKDGGLIEKGHINELGEIINELVFLHGGLLNLYQDTVYKKLYEEAKENLQVLAEKSGKKNTHELEAGLNGLYGVLVLKMQGKGVSEETEEGIKTVSEMFAYLAKKYHDMKSGTFDFGVERKN